jgi:uncharacterized protein
MQMSVQNKNMLLAALLDNKQKIRSFGVIKLSVFGSFVNGKVNPDSDVDLLVEFEPQQKNYDNFMELSFYLEDILGRKVELVTTQSLNKHIGPYIIKQAEYVAI